MLLGRLLGLKELALGFQSNNDDGSPVCITPLYQLTNLQRLVVQGVVPSAAQVPAAAAGEGGGGGSGEHGSVSNSRGFLPISLTSLEIQGGGWDDRGRATTTVKDWMNHIPSGNQLQELHVRNFGRDASKSLFNGVELSSLSVLKQLHVLMEPASGIATVKFVLLPLCLTSLSNLEVLQVSSSSSELPGPQYYFVPRQGQLGLLNHLPKLKKLGWVIDAQQLEVPASAQLNKLEEVRYVGALPSWLTASVCPQLQRIMVEPSVVFPAVLQRLTGLTQLTALRLDERVGHARSAFEGWGTMRVLAHSLHRLRRLELVNFAALGENEQQPKLAVPDLSEFTQLKQLQLFCLMAPNRGIPEQPSSSEFLQGLSKLTQLEQLQVEGYSTVTATMVCCLAQSLPQLQLLEVGLCKHPDLEKEVTTGEDVVSWEELHPGFKDVQQLCKLVKGKLQVKVGYAHQWL